MERKRYLCSGCGKVVISEKIPYGWRKVWDNPERCICDQCRGEMGTPASACALSPTSITLAIASS